MCYIALEICTINGLTVLIISFLITYNSFIRKLNDFLIFSPIKEFLVVP